MITDNPPGSDPNKPVWRGILMIALASIGAVILCGVGMFAFGAGGVFAFRAYSANATETSIQTTAVFVATIPASDALSQPPDDWQLVFSDDFSEYDQVVWDFAPGQ